MSRTEVPVSLAPLKNPAICSRSGPVAFGVLSLFKALSLGTHEGLLNRYVNGWELSRLTVHVFTAILDSSSAIRMLLEP